MALKKDYPTLNKVKNDEEIFVLRAQDASSAKLVVLWIAENLQAPDDKLREAFECALRMRSYEHTKAAD
jgi:hypothetical protein